MNVSKEQLIRDMEDLFGPERVLKTDLERLTYTYDSSFVSQQKEYLPDVVVCLNSTESVSRLMKYAYEHEVPVTPRGAGSGQTGGSVPLKGGIVLDLSTWKDVEVDDANMQVIVRPGVVHAELNKILAPYNLFFPPDPGSSAMATIGGMVGNNASGLRAVKYGATFQYVLGLEVVLPNGEVIKTGGVKSKALKSVSGIDLTRLYCGSEGTLGVITQIRLKVQPKAPYRGIMLALFDKLEDSAYTVLDVFKVGLIPSGIEILDDGAIRCANTFKPELKIPEVEAALFFEINGSKAAVEAEGAEIKAIVEKRCCSVEWATDPERMTQLWQGRQVIGSASARYMPGKTRVFAGEDVCFPISKVPEALRRIKMLSKEFDIPVVIYGHIGDGNMHTAPIMDPLNPVEVEKTVKIADAIHRLALEMGGTTTGEHGVGFSRAEYMEEEHGKALDVMWAIKKAIDSKGIMNPGKIWQLGRE
ncbi:MAG: FAD-binding oxidoreductase [Peptococcaceae bacterium]|jgi:glycolate oxidase|nr:FAD-binding oxidoreductase [Peptococcaceae bacterium]